MQRDRYVSTRTYADTWSVTPDTVRKWIDSGIVTAVRINQRVIRILDVPPGRQATSTAA